MADKSKAFRIFLLAIALTVAVATAGLFYSRSQHRETTSGFVKWMVATYLRTEEAEDTSKTNPTKNREFINTKNDAVVLTGPRLSDDELLEYVHDCNPEYPSIIYYNRVPKCASETMLHYITKNVAKSKESEKPFVQRHYKPNLMGGHAVINPYQTYISPSEVAIRSREMQYMKPAVFDSHTAYISYLPHNAHMSKNHLGDISYINVIREPFSRVVSHQNYYCKTQGQLCGLSPTEVIKEFKNSQLLYICGHQKECLSKGEDALYIAKIRLVFTYSLVGITERFDETTEILRKILPKFFLLEYNGAKENVMHSSPSSLNISQHDLETFRKVNKEDIDFYQFAVRVFEKKMKLCL